MKKNKVWILGLLITITVIIVPILIFLPKNNEAASSNPWANVPVRVPTTNHSNLLTGPYETGEEVTQACLECHENAAFDVMQTSHWKWESDPVLLEGRDEPVTIGKKNQLNNFCIGIQSNWTGCTRCHTGYGWEDADFDFSNESAVDCLVCHDQSGGYVKGAAGRPVEGVDLVAAAQSVGTPTRENCGGCHFNGGGGNAVKHGDLDETLYFPPESEDVHMGKHDFVCIDCHQTEAHDIQGRSLSLTVTNDNQVYCVDCHTDTLHKDERINAHTDSVACQTCHIPTGATEDATKMYWDWSTAGQDLPEDPHVYMKIKGSFIYENDFIPEYRWFNGTADRYLLGDTMDPAIVTPFNLPLGGIEDAGSKIFPFKVHRGKQVYDTYYNYFLQPKTVGEGGFWTDFDWNLALELGAEATGIPYSGEYGFAETEMYLRTTHMVQPANKALQCTDCHGEEGRMDWISLGYPGDPLDWGGRLDD